MRKLMLTGLLWLSASAAYGQPSRTHAVVLGPVARLDDVFLNRDTTMSQLLDVLGSPSRREMIDGYLLFIWDSLGIVVRARSGDLHEVSFHFRLPEPMALPGGEVFRDPAEPTSPFEGLIRISSDRLPDDMASFAPRDLTCDSPAGNYRCPLINGTQLFVTPNRGPAEMAVVRLRP